MGRRQKYTVFPALLLLILFHSDGFAAQRALFRLDNLRQSLEFTYEYDGRESGSDGGSRLSSQQHRLEEIYHFGINYAVYDPRIFKGKFAADGKLTQENFSSDGTGDNGHGTDYQYSLEGTLLSQKPTPISFFSRSGTSRVQRLFSKSYDLTTDSNGATIAYNNRHLPAFFSYSRVTNETSGLEQDRQQQTENFVFSLSNSFRQMSRTEITLSRFTDQSQIKNDGGETSSLIDTLTVSNNLSWDSAGRRRSIYSLFRFTGESGERKEDLSSLQESLFWELGKALRWGTDYLFSHRRVPHLTETENQGRTWLEHRLFQSLVSRITIKGRETDRSIGRETYTSGAIDFVFQKKLLPQSGLQLEFAQGVDVTDRKLVNSRLVAPDETFLASLVAPYRLQHPNVLMETIAVRSNTPGNLHFTFPFTEGVDYLLVQVGAFTEIRIIAGGNIVEGVDNLVVTYQYLENPDIRYATYLRRIGGSLTLLDSRYRLFASLDQSNQELLAGQPDVLQLNDLNIWRIGAQFANEQHAATLEYMDFASTLDKHRSIEGSWRYNLTHGPNGLTMYLNERYTRFDTVSSNNSRRWENVTRGSAVYRRTLFSSALFQLKADYAKALGDGTDRDDISTGASIQMRISRFILTLTSLISWQKNESILTRNDLVRLELVRFF
jgi:hypothetical protein